MSDKKKTYPFEVLEVRKSVKDGKESVYIKPVWSKPEYSKGIANIVINLRDGTSYTVTSDDALFKISPEADIDYKVNAGLMTAEQGERAKETLANNNVLCRYTFKPKA